MGRNNNNYKGINTNLAKKCLSGTSKRGPKLKMLPHCSQQPELQNCWGLGYVWDNKYKCVLWICCITAVLLPHADFIHVPDMRQSAPAFPGSHSSVDTVLGSLLSPLSYNSLKNMLQVSSFAKRDKAPPCEQCRSLLCSDSPCPPHKHDVSGEKHPEKKNELN